MKPTSLRVYACFAALLLPLLLPAQTPSKIFSVTRYQAVIDTFLHQDSIKPPPKGAIEFIGSSIFRQWTTVTEDMAPLPVYNRAFGGSRTAEVLYYMDRIVLPYQPQIIVYYCGSNDINNGDQPADIAGRFFQFCERVHQKQPETRVFYVSINRAPQKMVRWSAVDSTNDIVKAYCTKARTVDFIDVNPVLFNEKNEPRYELYKTDKLHFKPEAYKEFTAIIKPILEKAWKSIR
ncbi:MAG: GDSL-type esterase/lipase family protein [Ignavibacteriales bacterium]|nr:GDSL-type esterase/lipase family protein [Ignavibacteriales bacterium]